MFLVLLRFADNQSRASQFMEAHKAWIQRGFAEGVFLLLGNLEPKQGGAIIAHDTSRAELEQRVNDDPFVAQGIVSAEILEITPSRANQRLSFLIAQEL